MIVAGNSEATTFVETGTFEGLTLDIAMESGLFQYAVSIELGDEIYAEACKKFAGRENLQLLHGDSGKLLSAVLNVHPEPCFFWLDAHKTAHKKTRRETAGEADKPLREELEVILSRKRHGDVIVIDDVNPVLGVVNGVMPLENILGIIEAHCRIWNIMHFRAAGKNGGVIVIPCLD